jgi:hypothetical protein
MADPSLFEQFMQSRTMKTPAFVFDRKQGFVPSGDSLRVVQELNRQSGKSYNLQPANSVMAVDGRPLWGTGGGVVFNTNPLERSTGYVDPLFGTAHTVAHEGAHAVFPSASKVQEINAFDSGLKSSWINPSDVPRDTGQRLRYVHETYGKPALTEESHAQGVASALLNKLQIPEESSISDFKHPHDYPLQTSFRGRDLYDQNSIGPYSPNEVKEYQTIHKGVPDFVNRIYNQGYNLIEQ